MKASAKSDLLCLKCHTVNGQGGQIGPDLSSIGKKASRENLLESILQPSKAIADQYVSWVIETQNGLVLTGLVVEDTADHVLLRDANGKDTRVDKKEIASRSKSPTSLMPRDLIGRSDQHRSGGSGRVFADAAGGGTGEEVAGKARSLFNPIFRRSAHEASDVRSRRSHGPRGSSWLRTWAGDGKPSCWSNSR